MSHFVILHFQDAINHERNVLYEFTTSWIGPLIIAIGVALRPYILKLFDKKGTFPNVLYVIVLLLLVLPFYMWNFKFNLTSMNDKTAKELVSKVLDYEMFNGYKLESLQWRPYDKKENLYNVKAYISDRNHHKYCIYLQPTCEFSKGCEVKLNKIMVIDPDVKDIALRDMDKGMFDHRDCSDVVVRDILLEKNVKPFFEALFAKWNSLENSKATYRIRELSMRNFAQTKPTIKNIQDGQDSFSNSCRADLYINGDFDIDFKKRNITKGLLSSMFDKIASNNGQYRIKTEILYNIYTNEDAGAVNVNSMFVDLEKLKKAAKSAIADTGNDKKHAKRGNCAFESNFPKDMIVYAAGAYGGRSTNLQIDESGHQATEFDIVVNSPKKPVSLILAAYEPSIWNVKWTKGTRIEAVYVSGYHRQIVLGIPDETPLINSTYKNKGKCGYFYITEKTARDINAKSRRIFDRNVDLVYISKRDGKVRLGGRLPLDAKLYASKDRILSNFIDKTKPLAGQAGLRDLERRGFLKAYSKEDVSKWADLQEKLYKKAHPGQTLPKVVNGDVRKSFAPRVVLNGYTILKKITIPAGLYGANAATFFLPKGVPFPEGNLGHSTLYDFNTGKCHGVLCGHI